MVAILLIEDNPEIRQAYRLALTRRGHTVHTEATGTGGIREAHLGTHDAIVLDAMLPDVDGFEVCRRIRARSALPIIMLTARDSDSDVVGGLEAGADDYIIKPVDPAVLDARIRAAIRRSAMTQPNVDDRDILESGDIRIDVDALQVTRAGTAVSLSPTELRLLIELVQHHGQVLSREQLLSRVWNTRGSVESRIVDAAIQRLRARIENDPAQPQHLQTVRGFGYRWD